MYMYHKIVIIFFKSKYFYKKENCHYFNILFHKYNEQTKTADLLFNIVSSLSAVYIITVKTLIGHY